MTLIFNFDLSMTLPITVATAHASQIWAFRGLLFRSYKLGWQTDRRTDGRRECNAQCDSLWLHGSDVDYV